MKHIVTNVEKLQKVGMQFPQNLDLGYIKVKNMFNHGVKNAEAANREKDNYQINLTNEVLFGEDPYFKSSTVSVTYQSRMLYTVLS